MRAPLVLVFVLTAIGATSCSSEGAPPPVADADIALRLRALPHVIGVSEITADDAGGRVPVGYRRFSIDFDQPADHDHPEAAHFAQRLTLLHKNLGAPMVLATSGYQLQSGVTELTATFETNQVTVEHRYFGTSQPAGDPTFAHLDVRQSAADFHEITLSLKGLYATKWLGTGASKGGETVLLHRFFYPDDTDATVAYVAPFPNATDDMRFPPFLRAVGGDTYADCRTKLIAFAKTVLRRREEVKPLIKGTYGRIGGIDVAIEHGVFEFLFGFWQYGSPTDAKFGCPGVPADDAPAARLAEYLEATGSLYTNIDDDSLAQYAAYYVQSARQLGSYAVDMAPFAGMLSHAETYRVQTYVTPGVPVVYDGAPSRDVTAWAATRAERVVLVYGEYDPWSAAALSIDSAHDSFRFVAPQNNHESSIASLAPTDRTAARAAISRWLGAPANASVTSALAPQRRRFGVHVD